jgi:uncharacterized protein (TIGR02231 family)
MKRSTPLFLLFLISSYLFASVEITVKSSPSSVKVFLRGAQLLQSARVKLEKGMNNIVFTGLAGNIDRNSISVSAKGDAVIMSVAQRFDYLRVPEKNPQIKILEDSLESQNKFYAMNQNESDAYKSEIDLILANKNIGNEKIGVSVSELQKMGEYYRKRLGEIKSKIYDLTVNGKKIQKNIDRIQNQLNELNNQLNKPVNEVVAAVLSKSGGNLDVDLSYLIYDAGWLPVYDARIDNINSPASLIYKADVWQNSGFDWNDVKIILSTRNPVMNNNKPELNPWYLDFERVQLYRELKAGAQKSASNDLMQAVSETAAAPRAESMADYTDVLETQLSCEFIPTINYSIAADNKPHSVSIREFTVPAKYEYYAAPKLDNNAFLVASLTEWSNYNLLPGEANIYFENSYVGRTRISPETTKDTLIISLGRDQSISVSRDILKDFTEDKFLSSDVERSFAFEIKIKNNKKGSVRILTEDQIPLSMNEDIVVRLIDSSGAVYDDATGKVRWTVEVDGGKSAVKKFVYSVRYPKDKKIQGL